MDRSTESGASSRHAILLVEGDASDRAVTAAILRQEGHQIVEAASLREMDRSLAERRFDLLLTDLALPDGIAFTRLGQLRRDELLGIIVVTARREEVDRILSLELGADDYLVKPLNPRELALRVRNLLRRLRAGRTGAGASCRFDGWTLDLARRHLQDPAGRNVRLTRSEFDLLVTLSSNPGSILDRDRLTAAVSRRPGSPDDRTIDVLIGRLRRKIEVDPQDPRLILTIHGQGYCFAAV
ncbi:response regulator transcription factor [Skermanella sp. TT6]|uniref:Response regulator transcription factor n=1 Tax=Skermanella cutis TaxID=2775420 RepID=A0ABX7BFJ8_9PROT|nr:response regulator transcription factor [Skermanella sp. TT6]QQP91846.1 response regulator transcription factor [Skermanella sp. TT6]